jgi:hypothetical protein
MISEEAVDQEPSLPPVVELEQLSHLLKRPADISLLAPDDQGRLRSRIKSIRDRLAGLDDNRNADILRRLETLTSA